MDEIYKKEMENIINNLVKNKYQFTEFWKMFESSLFYKQILQDHEKAKNWDSIVSISNKYGIVSPLQLAMDYNEIVNRLRERIENQRILLKSIEESEKSGSDYHLSVLDWYHELQRIRDNKK